VEKVIVIGGGGHAKVIIDIIQSMGKFEIVGFTDNDTTRTHMCNVPYLGDDTILPDLFKQGVSCFCIGIGDNKIRKKLFDKTISIGLVPINAISTSAYVSPYAKLGRGIVIMPGAVVNSCAIVEDNVIINTLSGVDHDCIISSHSHIAPGASITGNVLVGEGAFVGSGSKVIPDIQIGEWSIVGAGAVVLSNVPANITVAGVPAKKISL